MTIKKSDLYASIWASCGELRGGMGASQYKDYVLFIKYISDKYGDKINTQVIQRLIDANNKLARTDFPDFIQRSVI
jgi:type I restriction enzyme M protein